MKIIRRGRMAIWNCATRSIASPWSGRAMGDHGSRRSCAGKAARGLAYSRDCREHDSDSYERHRAFRQGQLDTFRFYMTIINAVGGILGMGEQTGRGRPSKPARLRRSHRLPVLLTAAEHAALNRYCTRQNVSASEVVRGCLGRFLEAEL